MRRCNIITLKKTRCKNITQKNSEMCTFHLNMEKKCKKALYKKIAINMKERKKKKWSEKQAIAISYSQCKSKCPQCERFFKK